MLLWLDGNGNIHFGVGVDETAALGIMWRQWNELHMDHVAKTLA